MALSLFLSAYIQKSETTLILSYTSDYPQMDGYYVLDGETITLTCQFNVSSQSVIWSVGDVIIYTYYNGYESKADTNYKDRIHDYQATEKKHRLVFLVSKSLDEGQNITCQVRISALKFEKAERQLEQIIGE